MFLATPLSLINSQSITNSTEKPRRHLLQSGMVISQCKWEDNNCLLKRRISSLASALKRLRKQRVQIGSSLNSRTLWGRAKETHWGRQLRLCYFSPLLSFFLSAGGPQLIFESRAGGRKTERARGHQFWIKKKKKTKHSSRLFVSVHVLEFGSCETTS